MRGSRLGLVVLLAACTDTDGNTTTADAAMGPADAAMTARCEPYPVLWPAAPGAEAAARTELAELAELGAMVWNASTGTPSTIFQLDTPLPACTDGQDVNAQVLALVAAHPTLFRLDPTEWRVPLPHDCRRVTGEAQLLNTGRIAIAGHPIEQDVFGYFVKRIDGVVNLVGVAGTYLPAAEAGLDERLTTCNRLAADEAEAAARATPLSAPVYSRCAPQGTVTYRAQANDTFAMAPSESWSWEGRAGQVVLTGTRTLRVTVNPANYTPDLLASGARCPVPDPDSDDFTVGFEITFDVHTGEILSIKPGLDCVVC